MSASTLAQPSREEITRRVHELGPWFHNLDLLGVSTAPNHFLGDYPAVKWRRFAHLLPDDLTNKTVLDLGCNAGFYSLEMKRRGAARVLGIDFDERYLAQARFAARTLGLEIEFRKMSVYDVAEIGETFDIVLFLGVLYHLRHPLLALDLIHQHVARDLFILQSLQRGSDQIIPLQDDYDFWQTEIFEEAAFPKMYFLEKRYAGDPTNWWIPNRACTAAMLRSAGFEILDQPESEVFVCRRRELPEGPRAIYAAIRRDDYD
jgi:tRNA (mo5U34)-methyltransferase